MPKGTGVAPVGIPFAGYGVARLQGLPAAGVSALTALTVPSILEVHIRGFSVAQFGALLPALIGAFTPQQAHAWLPEHIAAITAAQTPSITYDQFSQFVAPDRLAPAAFGALSHAVFQRLTPQQVIAITADQFAAIPGPALAQIAPASLPSVSQLALKRLSAAQAAHLTVPQAQQFDPTRFSQMPAQAMAGLVPATFGSLPVACIQMMTGSQAKALDARLAGALTTAQFQALEPNRGRGDSSDLSPAAFAALDPAGCIAHLSQTQAVKISAEQIAALILPQLQQIHPDRLNDLRPTVFARLAPALVTSLSGPQVQAITPDQARQMTSNQFAALPAASISLIAFVTFGNIPAACIARLTIVQAAAITPDQTGQMTAALFNAIPDGGLQPTNDLLLHFTNAAFNRIPATAISTVVAASRHFISFATRTPGGFTIEPIWRQGRWIFVRTTTAGTPWCMVRWGLLGYGFHLHPPPAGQQWFVHDKVASDDLTSQRGMTPPAPARQALKLLFADAAARDTQ